MLLPSGTPRCLGDLATLDNRVEGFCDCPEFVKVPTRAESARPLQEEVKGKAERILQHIKSVPDMQAARIPLDGEKKR